MNFKFLTIGTTCIASGEPYYKLKSQVKLIKTSLKDEAQKNPFTNDLTELTRTQAGKNSMRDDER